MATFAFPVDVEVGKQLSEVIPAGEYEIVVRCDDPQIRRIDIIVNLENSSGDPGFIAKIETFDTSFSDPPVSDFSSAIGPGTGPVTFMSNDNVRVKRREAGSNKRFFIQVRFNSYFDKTVCECPNPATAHTKKKITITMDSLSAGHLQSYVHAFTGVPAGGGVPCHNLGEGFERIDSSGLSFIKQDVDPAKSTDVILVLDSSGSMATGDPVKINLLRDAALAFLLLWANEPIPGDPSSAPILKPNDHAGTVFSGLPRKPSPTRREPRYNLSNSATRFRPGTWRIYLE